MTDARATALALLTQSSRANKTCCPVPTICIYTVNRNHVNLCLQRNGDLYMCDSQNDRHIARIVS